MKAATRLLQRVPLIKFVGGPHQAPAQISNAVKQHPCAPEGLVPGKGEVIKSTPYFNSNSIEPKDGEVFSRSQLSPRFRYTFPKEDEAESIISGGASIVF